jgi:hypothetical protein
MAQVDGRTREKKTNLYRAGVDMPALPAGQSPQAYCAQLLQAGQARLTKDAALFRNAPSPTPASPNLLAFLKTRFAATLMNLQCRQGR